MTEIGSTDVDDVFVRVVATCAAVSVSCLAVTLWLRRIGW